MNENGRSGLHVVIPTVSASRAQSVEQLAEFFNSNSATVTIVANGASAAESLRLAHRDHIDRGRNLGFAAAVNLGAAERQSWEWLLVSNDDITIIDPDLLTRLNSFDGRIDEVVLTFGDECGYSIPGPFATLMDISLLRGAVKKIIGSRPHQGATFFPFSFVVVSAAAWTALEGLDERFDFTYEDVDFAKRALDRGVTFHGLQHPAVEHARSMTSRRYVASVLPVGVWGAYEYLTKWKLPSGLARVICVMALFARLPLVPFSKAGYRGHILGIGRSILALLTNTRPMLPSYEEL